MALRQPPYIAKRFIMLIPVDVDEQGLPVAAMVMTELFEVKIEDISYQETLRLSGNSHWPKMSIRVRVVACLGTNRISCCLKSAKLSTRRLMQGNVIVMTRDER